MIELDLVQISFIVTYVSLWILSFSIGLDFNKFLGSSEKFKEFYKSIYVWLFVILTFINKTVPTGYLNEHSKIFNAVALIYFVMYIAYCFGMMLGILLVNQLLTYLILILWESLRRLHHWINQL